MRARSARANPAGKVRRTTQAALSPAALAWRGQSGNSQVRGIPPFRAQPATAGRRKQKPACGSWKTHPITRNSVQPRGVRAAVWRGPKKPGPRHTARVRKAARQNTRYRTCIPSPRARRPAVAMRLCAEGQQRRGQCSPPAADAGARKKRPQICAWRSAAFSFHGLAAASRRFASLRPRCGAARKERAALTRLPKADHENAAWFLASSVRLVRSAGRSPSHCCLRSVCEAGFVSYVAVVLSAVLAAVGGWGARV